MAEKEMNTEQVILPLLFVVIYIQNVVLFQIEYDDATKLAQWGQQFMDGIISAHEYLLATKELMKNKDLEQ